MFSGSFEENFLTEEPSCREGLWLPVGFSMSSSVSSLFWEAASSVKDTFAKRPVDKFPSVKRPAARGEARNSCKYGVPLDLP